MIEVMIEWLKHKMKCITGKHEFKDVYPDDSTMVEVCNYCDYKKEYRLHPIVYLVRKGKWKNV